MKCFFLLVLLLTTTLTFAEGTRTWEQSKYEDFLKGTPHGVAISSGGTLELAPGFKLTASTPSSAVWAVTTGARDEIFAATGSPARVYRITSGAKPVAIFQPQELQVQALVMSKNGVLYAATNPDGKVYRLEHNSASPTAIASSASKENGRDARSPAVNGSDWKSSVYFDPQTKYIWALALDD